MGLRLGEHWLWDFWLADDGDRVHAFYLQAPRSLGDPELRHRNATVGHAVSRDLREWEVLPSALRRGPAGAFDDLATWTGCVVRDGGGWRMYYTGISTRDDGARQRVGAARSADLMTWERAGELSTADERWYEPADWRGVVGHAVSADDGAMWQPRPPLSAPGELRQLAVPQLLELGDGRFRVLVCARAADHAAARLARGATAEWGMATLTGPGPTGPFALDDGPFLLGDPAGDHYAARAIERDGRWWLLAWHMHAPDGSFVGELSDPMELRAGPDGTLSAG